MTSIDKNLQELEVRAWGMWVCDSLKSASNLIWHEEKWELLKALSPSNPICCACIRSLQSSGGDRNDKAKMSVIKLMIQIQTKVNSNVSDKSNIINLRISTCRLSYFIHIDEAGTERSQPGKFSQKNTTVDADESPISSFIRCLYRGLIIYCESSSFRSW